MKRVSDINQLKIIADETRIEIIKMLVAAKSGHSAGPLDMADVFTALYFNLMNVDPKKPWKDDRDRLILSNGHICPVLYATLAKAGYFPLSELKTLRKLNTRLQGHPHIHSLPGIETSAGPLGQGTSVACGIAYAGKMDKKNYRVFLSMGDGELNEGQCWEAIMFAGKYKLDNLIGFVDRNGIQIDGNTEDIMPLNPLADKFKAFNWNVIEINGNDMDDIISGFNKAIRNKDKPSVVICKTVAGKGVKFMEGKYEWHGKPPSKEEAVVALDQILHDECKLKGLDKEQCRELLHRGAEI